MVCSVGWRWGSSGLLICSVSPARPDIPHVKRILAALLAWYGYSPLACVVGFIYVLWCLNIEAIYRLLWTYLLCQIILVMKSQGLVPQHCRSKSNLLPLLAKSWEMDWLLWFCWDWPPSKYRATYSDKFLNGRGNWDMVTIKLR